MEGFDGPFAIASVATIPGSLRRLEVVGGQFHLSGFSRHDSRELEAGWWG